MVGLAVRLAGLGTCRSEATACGWVRCRRWVRRIDRCLPGLQPRHISVQHAEGGSSDEQRRRGICAGGGVPPPGQTAFALSSNQRPGCSLRGGARPSGALVRKDKIDPIDPSGRRGALTWFDPTPKSQPGLGAPLRSRSVCDVDRCGGPCGFRIFVVVEKWELQNSPSFLAPAGSIPSINHIGRRCAQSVRAWASTCLPRVPG